MPVLSAMGVQVCPVPSAVMSTHTGGFGVPLFHDLSPTMEAYVGHWLSLGLEFTCIYSGFLASEQQIETVGHFLDDIRREGQLVVVDPVMGDNGKLYRTYTPAMVVKMGLLARKAKLITPNPTEAALLLNRPFSGIEFSAGEIKEWLRELTGLGPEAAVITGIQCWDGSHANIGYDRLSGKFWRVKYKHIPVSYPGTGDIFASVLTGGLLNGQTLPGAMAKATRFVSRAVEDTCQSASDPREGVMLEKVIAWLCSPQADHSYEQLS